MVPQDLFLWFSYCVPVPKREFLIPRKTLIVFATPEMASYFEDLSATGGLQKVKTLPWAERGRYGIDIV